MSFADLLKKPLPSKNSDIPEDTTGAFTEDAGPEEDPELEDNEPTKTEDSDDDDDDDDEHDKDEDDELDSDDFDPDDLTDEELDALDADLSDEILDDLAGEAEPEDLTPEEEREADDMMSVAATTVLINDELSATERASFLESKTDVECAINEGLLLESDINMLAADLGLDLMTEGKNYNKPTLIRLDKESKMKQLYAIALNVTARAHQDPDYKKYKKILRMKKLYKKKFEKKYHAEAMKRMKVYYKRLTSSKSGVLSSLGQKLSGKK